MVRIGDGPGNGQTLLGMPCFGESSRDLGLTTLPRLSGQLDDAEDLYRQSLAVEEDIGNQSGMTDSYHQLSVFAMGRGLLDEAEEWCLKAIAVSQETGNQKALARSLAHMGVLAEQQKEPAQALEWTVRCVAVFEEFPHPATVPGPVLLARLTAQLGTSALETAWQAVVCSPVPQAVHDYIDATTRGRGDSEETR
jgi:hypothetical protein